ncbi:ethanolamine ammonia-lyase reactivating factor EutA [Megamonas hypermegale]|uniref:ethanolamine ammonia-lyase reactivating factor EutA n=1 Tax=Megamonas hypermegale TaxID=158847 RepID=UPI0026ED025C|nr:ethanolamine ammonia-lyase reactivating factor EutA [Megamonas hypermegale]
MQNSILSVGIDLGTSTTQIIFSKIYMQNSSVTAVPAVKITDKKIIYRSKIYFTPLINKNEINLAAIQNILQTEYDHAGIKKEDISTGAIIITGETARKSNAEKVLKALSDFAGDFVVATAGPDLESILAGYGAGAGDLSQKKEYPIVNYDIGGGTTNAALFFDGNVEQTFSLDIGGRLVRLDNDKSVIYISKRILPIINKYTINLKTGNRADFLQLKKLTDKFAAVLLKISSGEMLSREENSLFITPLTKKLPPHHVMFSGGVAEFVYSENSATDLNSATCFDDIGPLLGQSIRSVFCAANKIPLAGREKIRATVIGAGSHCLHISGSTVFIKKAYNPLKNLPAVFVPENNQDNLSEILRRKLSLFAEELPAISLKGKTAPSYSEVKYLAKSIADALKDYKKNTIVILLQSDFAKALGIILQQYLPKPNIICLDNIKAHDGDYVDIGTPINSVVPVVVKTLIFEQQQY